MGVNMKNEERTALIELSKKLWSAEQRGVTDVWDEFIRLVHAFEAQDVLSLEDVRALMDALKDPPEASMTLDANEYVSGLIMRKGRPTDWCSALLVATPRLIVEAPLVFSNLIQEACQHFEEFLIQSLQTLRHEHIRDITRAFATHPKLSARIKARVGAQRFFSTLKKLNLGR